MPRSVSRRASLAVAVIVGLARCLAAQEDSVNKYRDLVRKLVSPNQKAIRIEMPERSRSRDGVLFPNGYDVRAQERIDEARHALQKDFERALPYLLNALDDNRYSLTVRGVDEYQNHTVGQVCRDVIASQLEVYRDKLSFYGPTRWEHFTYGPVSREWYSTRKGRSLADLQVEAIDWAIELQKAEPAKVDGGDRRKELAELLQLRDGIAKSGKSALPDDLPPMVIEDWPAKRAGP